jgi:hypothetical protein
MDQFWEVIDQQLAELKTAQSADDVMRILAKERDPYYTVEGDTEGHGPNGSPGAFFGGSGGDASVEDALYEAGWRLTWAEASYHWVMQAPNGDQVTYVEGDVYRGDTHPKACRYCGRSICSSSDPAVPWVHLRTNNSYCDVRGPADAVAMAGAPGRTEAEPAG